MFKTRARRYEVLISWKNQNELTISDEFCDCGFDKFRRKSAKTSFDHITNTFAVLLG